MIALPPEVIATMASSGLSVEVFEGLRRRLVEGGWTSEENRIRGVVEAPHPGDVAALPADVSALRARGEQALRAGQVGVVLLNGGMATRFGERVKGVVEVTEGRSFLGLKVQDAGRAAARAGGPPVPVMLMNSRATTDATIRHLEARAHFGHPASSVWTFEQQWAVRLEPSGAVFCERDGRPSYYGPGHGDLPGCLIRSGLLDRFEAGGGRYLLMSNVDNVAATLDPVLLGWHIEAGGALTVEVVDKHTGDVGGAPWRVDGRPQIVETFRLPLDLHQIEEIVAAHDFRRMSGGRRPGQERADAFVRSGTTGGWRRHFTPTIESRYREVLGEFPTDLGLPPLDW